MSDYTKLHRDIADCMSRAGSPLNEDQKLLLAGYLAPVQQKLADCDARVAELESAATQKRIDSLNSAFILRKQAEAVEAVASIFAVKKEKCVGDDMAQAWATLNIGQEIVAAEAQRLRQQAAEAERAGGEK